MSYTLNRNLKRRQLLAIVAVALVLGNSFFPFLGWSAVKPNNAETQTSQNKMWGLVYAKGAHPNDQVTMSVVTDPSKIENIADLDVILFEKPKELQAKSVNGKGTQTTTSLDDEILGEVSVNLGDGPQPADKPIVKRIPWNAVMMTANIVLTKMPNHSIGGGAIPIDTTMTTPATTPTPGKIVDPKYHMPPIATPGAMTVIEGPNSGNMNEMNATINGKPMIPVASRSSGESFYFEPEAIPPATDGSGQSIVRFQAGKGMPDVELPTAVANVKLQANREMVPGQTETVEAIVNVSSVKDWTFGAPSRSLVKPDAISGIKDLKKDAAKNRGAIVVKLEDCTRDVVEMNDVEWDLHEEDFVDGVATKKVKIHAEKQGQWLLKALIIPELPESTGQAIQNGKIPGTPLVSIQPGKDSTANQASGSSQSESSKALTKENAGSKPSASKGDPRQDTSGTVDDAIEALLTNTEYGKALLQKDPKLMNKVTGWQFAKSDLASATELLKKASAERAYADWAYNMDKLVQKDAQKDARDAIYQTDLVAKDPSASLDSLNWALTQSYSAQRFSEKKNLDLQQSAADAHQAARVEEAATDAVKQAQRTADEAANALDPGLRVFIEHIEKAGTEKLSQPSVEEARDEQPPSPSTQQR